MKLSLMQSIVVLALGSGIAARGALYSFTGFANGGLVTDGSTAGWSDTEGLSDFASGATIAKVTVTLTISGGFNGDLYGYLSHNGVLVPLLQRVGSGAGSEPAYSFGFSTSGFDNITLDDAAEMSIHDVQNPAAGLSYRPDGPTLAAFNGMNPNGSWTLFFADLSSGGGQSAVSSWSLDVTAVPEPVNFALGMLGGLASLIHVARRLRVRSRV